MCTGSEDDASEKENVITRRYPKRKRKFEESESNALSSRKPLRAKVHKRQRNASEQEQITTSKRRKDDKDEKKDDKEQKKDKAPIVIPLSPRARTVEELRREFPKDFERVTDSHVREQELYLPRVIKQQLRGKRCLTCDYLGPVRFDTVRHILLRHLKLKNFPCDNCKQEFHKLNDLKKHFQDTHAEVKEEPSGMSELNPITDKKSVKVAANSKDDISSTTIIVDVQSTIITADNASEAVTAVLADPEKLEDHVNTETDANAPNVENTETAGESSDISNNDNFVKTIETAKKTLTARRNLSNMFEAATDNQSENTNGSKVLLGSESNENANLNDEEKCENKKKSSINAHFVQTSGDDNLPSGNTNSELQEGKATNLDSPVESELTPRKRPLLKKTTARQDSRKLYNLVMKPVLNEDSSLETSFKRLVPVIDKFYACNVCHWKFELSDEHKKHLLELHSESVTNNDDDNTRNNNDTIEDRSEILPESTIDETDEEENSNDDANHPKVIDIRKQILREQLSRHLLESHSENVTNTDDYNTRTDNDTIEDRSEILPESTIDESDEEENSNGDANHPKIIDIRKQILREQLSRNYQCSICK